jgi:hypothetical protein
MARNPLYPPEGPRGLFNAALSWFLRQRITQIASFVRHPYEAQEHEWQGLLKAGKQTEYGKEHRFDQIQDLASFKAQVPIVDYEDLAPYIERVMQGEQRLLWPSTIKWFAKSSGTTSSRSKFIPVSKEALEECHFRGGRDLMSLYCRNVPDTKVFSGRGLIMGGSHQVNKLSEGSYYGDVSAVMMQNMPLAARFIRTPDMSIALMEDWEEKLEKMAETTIQQNVTHIAGVPTWTLVLIRKIFEKTGKDNLLDVWPNLELYIHGGVSFQPYREMFKQLIRPAEDAEHPMHYIETYNASEGFFGIQDRLDSRDMLLMLDYGVFYEFIPLEEAHKDQPETVQLPDVEIGKNYAVVVSTNAGLWRYRIGDTIRFTETYPFRIQVSGRVKHFINAFGEELIIDNADQALAKACAQSGASIKEYTAAPIYFEEGSKGGHEWLLEFNKSPENLERFGDLLDQELRQLNSDYDAKRFKNLALEAPKIHSLEQGTFYKWLKYKGKLGGQHKVPRLSNSREYVDEILEFSSSAN